MPAVLRSTPVARVTRQQAEHDISGLIGNEKTRNEVERQRTLRNQVKDEIEGPSANNYDDGIIVAKEGKRYLVLLQGSDMRAVVLDSVDRLDNQIDNECQNKLAPDSHAAAIRKRAENAGFDKREFARDLEKVRESNKYGIRVIWRLEFKNGNHTVGLNCGKTVHDQICRKLGIKSFHDLLPDEQAQSNGMPAATVQTQDGGMEDVQQNNAPLAQLQLQGITEDVQMGGVEEKPLTPVISDLKNEIQGIKKPAELAHPKSVGSGMKDDATIHEERQKFIAETERVIIAERSSDKTEYILVQEADKVRVLLDTAETAEYEYSFSNDEETDDFAPALHLDSLLRLAEKGLDAFRAGVLGIRRAENSFPSLDLDVWLFETHGYSTELRCDHVNGTKLLSRLNVNEFETLVALCNTAPSHKPRSQPPHITNQNNTPPPSRRSSPRSRAHNSDVLPSVEIATPTTTRTTNTHPASEPHDDEYHLIAMHLPRQGQVEEDHTPCIVKGGPYQYELWKWNDVKNHASVKPCAKSQQFHKEDKTILELIKKNGGFAKVDHDVITTLTWKRGEDDFINTVIVSINNEVVRTEALNLRKENKNNNQGPLQCCISDFKKYGGKESKAIAGIQDNPDAKDYLQYREDKKNSKKTRAKSRGLTPFHTDAGDLSRKLSEKLYEDLSEQLFENLATFMDEISLRIANLENRYAASESYENSQELRM